jgi:hypothetical protein
VCGREWARALIHGGPLRIWRVLQPKIQQLISSNAQAPVSRNQLCEVTSQRVCKLSSPLFVRAAQPRRDTEEPVRYPSHSNSPGPSGDTAHNETLPSSCTACTVAAAEDCSNSCNTSALVRGSARAMLWNASWLSAITSAGDVARQGKARERRSTQSRSPMRLPGPACIKRTLPLESIWTANDVAALGGGASACRLRAALSFVTGCTARGLPGEALGACTAADLKAQCTWSLTSCRPSRQEGLVPPGTCCARLEADAR